MDIKNLNDRKLQEELSKATYRLSVAESEYVEAQNQCTILEAELNRRREAERAGVSKVDMRALMSKWNAKAEDIRKAAAAFAGDPKSQHSLTLQADLILSCVFDLEKLVRDSLTTTTHT